MTEATKNVFLLSRLVCSHQRLRNSLTLITDATGLKIIPGYPGKSVKAGDDTLHEHIV